MPTVRPVPLILLSFLLAVCCAAAEKPPTKGPLAESVAPYIKKKTLAGAVMLVASKDAVLAVEAAGYADIAAKKPMAENTLFWIASMTKPFTATAVMMLVEEGKVKIDEPVATYLPEFKVMYVADGNERIKAAHPITVREILTHTAGLAFMSPLEGTSSLDGNPLETTVLAYSKMPLQFQPGTKFEYSNAGINVAGRIVEVASGMPYEDFMRTRLFEPLGMKDTTFWPSEEQVSRLAKSYTPNAKKDGLDETKIKFLKYPLNGPGRYAMPGGGIFSTARDLAAFCRMILNGGTLDGRKYLSGESVKTMTTYQAPEPVKAPYGLGWAVILPGFFGHGGAYNTDMTINTWKGRATIFLVQHAEFHDDGEEAVDAFKEAAAEVSGK